MFSSLFYNRIVQFVNNTNRIHFHLEHSIATKCNMLILQNNNLCNEKEKSVQWGKWSEVTHSITKNFVDSAAAVLSFPCRHYNLFEEFTTTQNVKISAKNGVSVAYFFSLEVDSFNSENLMKLNIFTKVSNRLQNCPILVFNKVYLSHRITALPWS